MSERTVNEGRLRLDGIEDLFGRGASAATLCRRVQHLTWLALKQGSSGRVVCRNLHVQTTSHEMRSHWSPSGKGQR